MVRHVWTVVCEKTVVDRQSNNVSMDVLEQLNLSPSDYEGRKERGILTHPIVVVSFWYRENLDEPVRSNARVSVRNPGDEELGAVEMDIDLTTYVRTRAFCRMPGLPVSGHGYYSFVTEVQGAEGKWKEVARVPLQLAIREDLPQAQPY